MFGLRASKRMYKFINFDKKLCHLLKHHLDMLDEDGCDIYTIWQFSPRKRWRTITYIFNNKALCRAGYFPLIYWLVLIISILGCVSKGEIKKRVGERESRPMFIWFCFSFFCSNRYTVLVNLPAYFLAVANKCPCGGNVNFMSCPRQCCANVVWWAL